MPDAKRSDTVTMGQALAHSRSALTLVQCSINVKKTICDPPLFLLIVILQDTTRQRKAFHEDVVDKLLTNDSGKSSIAVEKSF